MKNSDRLYMFLFGTVVVYAILFCIGRAMLVPDIFWEQYNPSTLPLQVIWDYVLIPHSFSFLLISTGAGLVFTYIFEKLDEAGH